MLEPGDDESGDGEGSGDTNRGGTSTPSKIRRGAILTGTGAGGVCSCTNALCGGAGGVIICPSIKTTTAIVVYNFLLPKTKTVQSIKKLGYALQASFQRSPVQSVYNTRNLS